MEGAERMQQVLHATFGSHFSPGLELCVQTLRSMTKNNSRELKNHKTAAVHEREGSLDIALTTYTVCWN